MYQTLFTCLHLVGLITIYILPRFIRGERSQRSTTQIQSNEEKRFVETKNSEKETIHTNNNNNNDTNDCETNILSNKKSQQNGIKLTNDDDNCDINVSDRLDAIAHNAYNGVNGTDTNTQRYASNVPDSNKSSNENRINKNNHLSMKIRERIDSETRNIEEFIDKTVTGIVELKDDLMRANDNETYANADGVRKRNANSCSSDVSNGNDLDIFLRKEMNMAVNQVNVLPAVLSNGHAD